ncbi:hypothetical protein LH464_01880 [Neorhizobium sp. T786]|uniref:hypothetical protein n=1 Tax=Pseudorhizobium xiangyangii TaxID=2883104 RepID=UPI001CFFFCDD|nr:hypothetical protein [Neorhizobium xiangyangii]MCB5201224.1 hypothetical protein [Neorhizobium xiangyangii]
MMMKSSLSALAAVILTASAATCQENPYPGRPGLAYPEGTPEETIGCRDLAKTIRDFNPPVSERIDLWASGPVTIVDTDKVLWYVGICDEPGIRVLCVTYSDNGMRIGDVVTVRGAMRIQDAKHILLDPCLASPD